MCKGSALVGVKYKHGQDKSIIAQRQKIRERANRIIYSIKYILFPSAMTRDRERRQLKKRKLIEAKSEESKASGPIVVDPKVIQADPNVVVMTKQEFENQQVQNYLDDDEIFSILLDDSSSGVEIGTKSETTNESASGISTEMSSLSFEEKRTAKYKGQRSGGHGQIDEKGEPLQDLYETPPELVDTIMRFIGNELNSLGILPKHFFDPAVGKYLCFMLTLSYAYHRKRCNRQASARNWIAFKWL